MDTCVTVAVTTAIAIAVELVMWAGIDRDETTGRGLRRLRVCLCLWLWCDRDTRETAVHERDVRGASWTNGWRRARARPSVENGLLAALEPVVQLPCACGHWKALVWPLHCASCMRKSWEAVSSD